MSLGPSLNPDRVHRTAPAKVNLALAVGPPREGDGLHPICSWFAPIDLADELLVTRLEEDRLSRYAILWRHDAPRQSPIDWSITKDLAVRAHLLLEQEAGRTLPVQLKLTKRIPVGGGLGGGSSDAAAMLLAVRDLFELAITDDRLHELALTLGSDVPFFLRQSAAIVEGVGERIETTPAPMCGAALTLVFPDFGCPTGAVYRAYDESPGAMREREVQDMARAGRVVGAELFNDLALPAEKVAPQLAELRNEIVRHAGRPAHVTGSGSTMFVVCEEGREQAAELAERLSSAISGCLAIAARFL